MTAAGPATAPIGEHERLELRRLAGRPGRAAHHVRVPLPQAASLSGGKTKSPGKSAWPGGFTTEAAPGLSALHARWPVIA